MSKPRVLLYDIETAPIIATVWQKYEANMVWSVQDWYMLCFAYKWLDEKKTYIVSQDDFKGYKAGSPDDSKVVKRMWELFNEADVVIAHNGNSFDQKKVQARMVIQGLDSPTFYQQIDTKLVAKRSFNFTSNKLDDLGEYFGLGKKHKTDASLWRGCMAGDKKSWAYMKKYNIQDVKLLEGVYLKMRPWDNQHPNLATISDRPDACKFCGENKGFWGAGMKHTKTQSYPVFMCKNCRGKNPSKSAEKRIKAKYA